MKNLFVNFENGDNCLVYTDELSEDEVKRFAEYATDESVVEVYHIEQDMLQFYCIDSRIWIDTPQKVEKVRKMIKS